MRALTQEEQTRFDEVVRAMGEEMAIDAGVYERDKPELKDAGLVLVLLTRQIAALRAGLYR